VLHLNPVMNRILALCTLVIVASCSDEKRDTLADSGGSGGGGGAGLGGSGGDATGGAGGTIAAGDAGGGGLPACGSPAGAGDVVYVSLAGSDGTPIATPFTATITVTGVSTSNGAQGSTYTLTGANQAQWSLSLYESRMPSGFIKVGDMFDLTVDAGSDQALFSTINQTVVLARGGQPIVFAASLNRFYRLLVPRLDAFGIQVTDAGAVCQGPSNFGCIPRIHAAHVTIAGESADVQEGTTATVGGFSFTVAAFTELVDTGNCDSKSATTMGGFKLP